MASSAARESSMMKRLTAVCALALSFATAQAQTKITIAATAAGDLGSGFLGVTEGAFARRGLDVDFKMVTVNSMMPAMLVSDTMQVAATTSSVLIQAVDSGLDLVALAGSGVADSRQELFGTVMKNDVPFARPEDYIGKKIGVPGIGAFLDVLFRNWLIAKGVDPRRVTFVEVAFPQMQDLLKQGTVDGVVTAEPIMSRIVAENVGKYTTNFAEVLPVELPVIIYSATRKWAQANPQAVKAFRETIAEMTVIANRRDKTVRDAIGKYVPMPPPVIASMKLGAWNDRVTETGLAGWVDIMKRQSMLTKNVDVKRLIVE
jgi:NitT/TauT family transport system substrate-binding protein